VKITSSKACNAFKTRVDEVQKLVSAAVPGASFDVDVQPKLGTKPDRGSFVVEVAGQKVVELIAMPRPFTAMKSLSMKTDVADKVIALLK
jgi:hypothetical protein